MPPRAMLRRAQQQAVTTPSNEARAHTGDARSSPDTDADDAAAADAGAPPAPTASKRSLAARGGPLLSPGAIAPHDQSGAVAHCARGCDGAASPIGACAGRGRAGGWWWWGGRSKGRRGLLLRSGWAMTQQQQTQRVGPAAAGADGDGGREDAVVVVGVAAAPGGAQRDAEAAAAAARAAEARLRLRVASGS